MFPFQGFFIFFDIQETTEGIPFVATSHMYSQDALNLGHLLSWPLRKLTDGMVPRTVKRDKFSLRMWFYFFVQFHQFVRWYIGRFQGAINESTSFCSSDIIPSRQGEDISHQTGEASTYFSASWHPGSWISLLLKTPFPVAFLNTCCHFSSYLEQILCDFSLRLGTHISPFFQAQKQHLWQKTGWMAF